MIAGDRLSAADTALSATAGPEERPVDRHASVVRGAGIAWRAALIFVLLGVALNTMRPAPLELTLGARLTVWLVWLGSACSLLLPWTLAWLAAARLRRGRGADPSWSQTRARALLAATSVFIGFTWVFHEAMTRRREPYDFPAELDAFFVPGIALIASAIAGIATVATGRLRLTEQGASWCAVSCLVACCGVLQYLACGPLAMIRAHMLAYFCSALALGVAWWAAAIAPLRVHRAEGGLAVVAGLCGVVLVIGVGGAAREAAWRDAFGLTGLVTVLSRVGDVDGDGYLATWASGGDCDDDDPNVNPFVPDRPNNQRDEDCSGADLRPEEPQFVVKRDGRRPDIWLLTVDALSARHLSLLGYRGSAHPTTPALAHWGARAVVFEQAYSAATRTLFAMSAMFAGRRPGTLIVDEGQGGRRVAVRHSLIEVVGALGYESSCITASRESSLPTVGCQRVRPVAVGTPEDLAQTSVSATQLEQSVEWLTTAGERPKFLWTHVMDPHAGYIPHGSAGPDTTNVERYDGEIAYLDALIGRALEQLTRAGRLEHTVIVLTADHGEQLDGRAVGHGPTVRGDLTHIPLLIWSPGHPGRRVRGVVSGLDIYPTLLSLIDVRERSGYLHGISLAPAMSGLDLPGKRLVLIEAFDGEFKERGVTDGELLFVRDFASGVRRLVRLASDPSEQRNLMDADAATARELENALTRLIRGPASG